jgi:uncharacterized protein (DUF1330 family)
LRIGARLQRAVNSFHRSEENIMNRHIALGLAMIAGAALGGEAVNSLHAQVKAPGAYAVVDIGAITNEAEFKTLLPKAGPSNAAFGGQFVVRTENIVAVDGTPPKRFVIVSFDSMDRAKAWSDSPAQKEIFAINKKSTNSRTFIVDGKM